MKTASILLGSCLTCCSNSSARNGAKIENRRAGAKKHRYMLQLFKQRCSARTSVVLLGDTTLLSEYSIFGMMISRFWVLAAAAAVLVKLSADWPEAPFPEQLVEAVGSYDPNLYVLAVRALYQNEDWEDDEFDEIDIEPDFGAKSDKQYYDSVSVNLLPVEKGMVDLNLVNKIHSPRIEAHFRHYKDEVDENAVLKKCAKDSFGNEIDDPLGAWVKYGDRIYCSDADLYALQLSKVSEQTTAFDRIVGDSSNKPLLVLYGSSASPRFGQMFETLYQFAESEKLRYVWRYVPVDGESASIPGWGAIVTPKQPLNGTKSSKIKYTGDLSKYLSDIRSKGQPMRALEESAYHELSVKITALVLEQPEAERYNILQDILSNLPFYGPYIQLIKNIPSFDAVKAASLSNQNRGASAESVGLYLNGASVHKLELNLPHVISKLETEVRLGQRMKDLGFTTEQSKALFSKFALMSAFREVQYRTGDKENRNAVYKHAFDPTDASSGGVAYFNNIEKDDPYDLFDVNRREAYLGVESQRLQFGQVPALRENAHELVFAINFSSSIQVKVFFTFAKIILDRNLPQQIAVIPRVDSDEDALITEKFYHILEVSDPKEAFALLYQYYDAPTQEEKLEVLEKVEVPKEKQGTYTQYQRTLKEFSLDSPSVIINGVIHDMKSPWQAAMAKQMGSDVHLLQKRIRNREDEGRSLKSVLFQDAKDSRNSRVSPRDLSNIRYKGITKELIDSSYSFKKVVKPQDAPGTFWLIGDFNSRLILAQFSKLLELLELYLERSLEIRIFNIAEDDSLLEKLHKKYGTKPLTNDNIAALKTDVQNAKSKVYSKVLPQKAKLLEKHHIQLHQPGMLFNSRYLQLNDLFEREELLELVDFEYRRRLSIFKDITDTYPDLFSWKGIMFFKKSGYDNFEWFDLVSSVVAKSFFLEDSQVQSDVDRFDFASLNFVNTLNITQQKRDSPVDVLAIIDPISDISQKIVSLVAALKDLPFVNVRVLLQPLETVAESTGLSRFYFSDFKSSLPQFDDKGSFVRSDEGASALGLVPKYEYSSDIDVPSRWLVVKDKLAAADHEAFTIDQVHSLNYKLDGLVVEGYAKDVKTAQSIATLTFDVSNQHKVTDGIVMHTLGYVQFQLKPDVWSLEIQKGSRGRQIYNLLSASDNKYDTNDQPVESVEIPVFSLHGHVIHPRLQEKPKKEQAKAKKEASISKNADINVFSLASGKLYERFISTMMLSVKKNTKSTVKFWLLRNFLSAEFVEALPGLAGAYDFEYELVTYKWPLWLRQQTKKHREVWGYKILFLDVLFPNQLDKVIFVDADQTARTDLKELVDTDLEGKVYGFPPMCDSREEVEGYRFWKQGYWKNVLQDDLRYHISALFVVDLDKFRQDYAGDRLRTHYQKLSSDKDSLSNLDQDLPNNMQRLIPIHTLEQDWLWCETWCSDESKSLAKMIDLCSDPFRKESKLERVQRLIPEWKEYDEQVQRLQKSESDTGGNVGHDEL